MNLENKIKNLTKLNLLEENCRWREKKSKLADIYD
jgi:hypothetical protein